MSLTIEDFKGRLLDADSHLQVRPQFLDSALGKTFAGLLRARGLEGTKVASFTEVIQPDSQNVWTSKGEEAPGAFEADIRLKALDMMGIKRQLLFPMATPASMMFSTHPEAATVVHNHNDYVLDWAAAASTERLHTVAVINMVDRDIAMAEAERVVARGAQAVNICHGHPPAGVSPADPMWEPFWSLLEEAGVSVLLHIGGEVGIIKKQWGDTPGLRPAGDKTVALDGEQVGPYSLSVMTFGPQAYLTALILDGVLERHPNLHIGVIELTAQWVGPFAEMLDQRTGVFKRLSNVLSMMPSEYIKRQVRVTPFWWEPVGKYIERYGMEDVYVFSSDFPHKEGGTEPIEHFWNSLKGHSDEVYEKFFTKNAALIL